jgi:hypothetical protein
MYLHMCMASFNYINNFKNFHVALALWSVVSYPPAFDETGAMGREIESRQGIG